MNARWIVAGLIVSLLCIGITNVSAVEISGNAKILWSKYIWYWEIGPYKKPGVDYNGDGATNVGMLSEDIIYMLTRNVNLKMMK